MHQNVCIARILYMKDYYSKVFGSIEPPSELLNNILLSISRQKKIRELKKHIYIMTPILLATTLLSAYAFSLVSQSASSSGAIYYLSLIFSDTSLVISNIGMFARLLAESAPILTTSILLIGLFSFMKICQYLFRDIDNLFKLIPKKQNYANI